MPDTRVQLQRRVLIHELRARLPESVVRSFAPFGWHRPIAADGGDAAEPLGPFTAGRASELGLELDLVVLVRGPHDVHDTAAWSRAYEIDPNACGPLSKWFDIGSADMGGTPVVEAPPDLVALAARCFPADVLARRRRFHAHMGWTAATFPPEVSLEDHVAAGIADAGSAEEADAGVERLAALVRYEGRQPSTDQRLAALELEVRDLRRAFEARGDRLAAERLRFGRRLDELTGEPRMRAGARAFLVRLRTAVRRRLRRG